MLVTGAAGFIGSHLVDALLAAGHAVVGVDLRRPDSDPLAQVNLAGALRHPRFRLVNADLATAALSEVVAGADTVFHLAAVPGVRGSWGERFDRYVTANVTGTHRLLAACEATAVRRVVFASSSSVYGPAHGPSRETDATQPISPYGVTKLAGEHLCRAHVQCGDTGLSVVALRYFTVYGPRQRPDMAIGRMLAAALFDGQLTLFGDGSQRREFTFVSDVVAATMAAARIDAAWAAINVGGGSSVSVIELLRLALSVTGRPVRVTAVPAQPGDVPATAADSSLAAELLDYQPQIDLSTGMTRHAKWLRQLPPQLISAVLPAHPTPVEAT